ncbi:MAG: RpiB/LacA/LacB family sugar-phosphate isomerase [Planctomycetaceae bacterium]|jgi:ribose 5-phosphate isomerase B|nr:RpiB/LacA/LacB family sugar-phosphate isomerase [Planctomycetaceae bacterium]
MKIILGSDHRGKRIQDWILKHHLFRQYEIFVIDKPCSGFIDYPDIAARVAFDVGSGLFDRGILICGTGIGMCVVANKFPGVRAAPCHNEVAAELSRRHNDANILCLAGDLLGERSSLVIVEKWLVTPFDNGRHFDRLKKIKNLENQNYPVPIAIECSEKISSENIVQESNISVHPKTVSGVA